jgi:acetyl esterase/lipase
MAVIPWNLPKYVSATDTPYSLKVDTGIVYGKGATATGDIDLVLDVYQPTKLKSTPTKAAIIFIHGGSFIDGSRSDMDPLCTAFANKGLVAFTIDYRLAGNNPPVQLPSYVTAAPIYAEFDSTQVTAGDAAYIDAKAAIRYVHAHADSFGIDTSNIFIGGASAGAIAALGAGETGPTSYISDSLGHAIRSENYPKASMSVRGVIDWSGGLFFDLWQLKATNPPIVIYHGTVDDIVPYEFAQQLVAASDSVRLLCELNTVEGGGHVPETGAPAGDVLSVSTSFVMRLIQGSSAIASRQIPVLGLKCARIGANQLQIENVPPNAFAVDIVGLDGRREAIARPGPTAKTWVAQISGGSRIRLVRVVLQNGSSVSMLVPGLVR